MHVKSLLPLLLSFVTLSALAQSTSSGSFSGLILDQTTRRPIEFVNIVILSIPDSSIVTGGVSDKSGRFTLTNIPFGRYRVHLRLLGYKEYTTGILTLNADQPQRELGTIPLIETTVNLDEVLVTSQRSLVNNSIDRKVFNVSQDVMSKAGSVSELLQNVPSIQVDIDGNVLLRGSSDVLILINGKNSPLMGKSRAEVLQQMPAASIDKIEVITNPSAKFRPDGTSGIINIVMKKNADAGLNGSTTLNAGNLGRLNGAVRLNYRPNGWNLHGSYSIRKDNRNRINTDTRDQTDASSVLTFYRDDAAAIAEPLSHSVVLGLDYEFSKQTTAGFAVNYFRNTVDRGDNAVRVLENSMRVPISRYEHHHTATESEQETGVEFSLDHAFDEEDHSLKLQISATREPENSDGRNVNSWSFPVQPDERDQVSTRETQTRRQATLDYTLPLGENSRFEAGYEGELGNNDIDNHVEQFSQTLQRFTTDTTVTNHFLYDENIHAVYATIRRSFGPFGAMGGLRLERSFIDTRLEGLDSATTNDYSSYYPTLHLSYALTPDAELQINYSRRVHRPHGDDLNPFPEYHDARNLSAGNPRLRPEYIHSIEFGCKFQTDAFTILPSVFHRYTYNRFTSLTQRVNDSTLLTTRANLSIDRSTGVEVVGSSSFGPLSANGSVNGFLNEIDASNLGYGSNKSVWTWGAGLTMSYRFARNSMLQLNSSFNSARLTPQGESRASWSANAGLRYEILEGQLSMTATVADIFKTQRREMRIDTPTLRQTVVNTRDAQVVYLGLTYYFGAPPKKQKDEDLKFDDSL